MSNLTSVTVTPINPFILVSTTQQFTAIAHFSDAPDLDVTIDPTTIWTAVDLPLLTGNAVATIANAGPFKGQATALTISGSSLITATYGGQTGTSILIVGLSNYTRIIEQTVQPVRDGTGYGETGLNAAHNPVLKLSVPNISLYTGGVTFINTNGTSGGPIGYTTVSGHPGDFSKLYIANEPQQFGNWVQLRTSDSTTTISFSGLQKNLGVVSSVCFDTSGNQLASAGAPVLVQIAGEAFVSTTDSTIILGSFLGPDANGQVKKITFDPENPTPILGYALENIGNTFSNMVLMRIQICGE